MRFIIKLFPEITIKSKPVRQRFVKQLRSNIRVMLRRIDPKVLVEGQWDLLTVKSELDDSTTAQEMIEVLQCTPGVANFSHVETYPLGDFDDIFAKTRAIYEPQIAGKTFVVRCKRTGSHDFKSIDVERYVGGGLNQHCDSNGVKLKDPDIVVPLEIHLKQLHIVRRQYRGLGGFPLGTQDPVLSLISGGFDSTVASYSAIKRGLLTHYCFFNLGGRAHEVGVKEVAYYLWSKFGASQRVRFITVPFDEVLAEILQQVDNSQMGVILKRMMLRAASRMAEQLEIEALVTGEAVAQVSSQTLRNLSVIDSVTNTLVLRPLIMTDKQDIINTAAAIGTEDFAKHMPEYCGVISVNPTTRAKPERIEAEEKRFDFEVLDRALANAKIELIDEVLLTDVPSEVEIKPYAVSGEIVLDIRHPHEKELRPLVLTGGADVKDIPFYELHSRYAELDQGRQYLLYCDKGVMSRLHASHLCDEGYKNVAVYRPEALKD